MHETNGAFTLPATETKTGTGNRNKMSRETIENLGIRQCEHTQAHTR